MKKLVLQLISIMVLCGMSFGISDAQTPQLVQLAVSPPSFDLELGAQGATDALRVFNLSELKTVTLQVNVYNWELDEQFQVQIIPPTEQSLDQWMHVNPVKFTLKPGQFQVVRFAVRPKVQPDPGEHRAILHLCQAPPDDEQAIQSNVMGCLGVVVYGNVGEVVRSGELHEVTIVNATNPAALQFEISSDGNAHVRMSGQYAIWNAATYPGVEQTEIIPDFDMPETPLPEGIVEINSLPTLPVLANTRRTVPLRTSTVLEPGEYIVDINGDLAGIPLDLSLPLTISTAVNP